MHHILFPRLPIVLFGIVVAVVVLAIITMEVDIQCTDLPTKPFVFGHNKLFNIYKLVECTLCL